MLQEWPNPRVCIGSQPRLGISQRLRCYTTTGCSGQFIAPRKLFLIVLGVHRSALNPILWKVVCTRAKNHQAIDDNDISCQIPTRIAPGSTIDIDVFTSLIQHAQISSQISTRLMSVKAFQQTPTALIETVSDLSNQLQSWRDSLSPILDSGMQNKPPDLSPTTRSLQIVHLNYAYYGSLMAIHTIFSYPWISDIFGIDQSPAFRNQVSVSSSIVADAARNIILKARYVEINAALPQWQVSTRFLPFR